MTMNAPRKLARRIGLLVLAGALAGLSGCAGTVIVDYSVQAQVSGRDGDGREWSAAPADVVTLPRAAGMASPFDAQQFRGSDFEWTFGTGTHGFGGYVVNRGAVPLCFRFDAALLSTNLHPEPVKLTISSMVHTASGQWTKLGSTDPKQRRYFAPPSICFEAGKQGRFSIGPQLDALFPNRTLFNVTWPEGVPELSEKGVGNWFVLELPLEREGMRQIFRVKLTAMDSKARISHY